MADLKNAISVTRSFWIAAYVTPIWPNAASKAQTFVAADLGGIRLLNAKQFKGATISRDQAGQLLAELGLKVR